jgi:hypothetical protein
MSLALSLATALTTVASPAQAVEPISPEEHRIVLEIQKSITEIGKKYQKSPEQIHELYRRALLTSDTIPKFGKGGVSIIRDSIYIVNKGTRNEIILENDNWISSLGNPQELVILSGRKVLGTFPTSNLPAKDDFIFILFDKDQAKYFDWKTLSGAVTYRQ